jgi:hypothetical protein
VGKAPTNYDGARDRYYRETQTIHKNGLSQTNGRDVRGHYGRNSKSNWEIAWPSRPPLQKPHPFPVLRRGQVPASLSETRGFEGGTAEIAANKAGEVKHRKLMDHTETKLAREKMCPVPTRGCKWRELKRNGPSWPIPIHALD